MNLTEGPRKMTVSAHDCSELELPSLLAARRRRVESEDDESLPTWKYPIY